ncbi:phage head-tail joining protein [Polynucleobacter sp. MWH-Aus1W21]|jgi:hypothetical protein|uniref:phage head-tail joining protein n=1 Tax=Polynucleobacter sp. MWH-Aus1W21 TaxID=1855880 RepID=UPI001BFE8D18|nr:hypothetical protein [Polynucleobacter sp. MWH-Aus1W21]QWD65982.1 hypothetical protein ICW03_10100 [Polynucleobacter sp. MWH-Aus1W21]
MTTYTLEHAQALREAIASGEHRVTYDGKTIEYRTVSDLKLALAEVEAALASSNGKTKTRQIRVTTSKGF